MFFTSQSAKIDERLSPEIREQFENDDDAPLKSVDVDLNGDGRMEKFILSGALSISGGNQWLVFDPARGVSRGMIIGAIIFVYREADEGYPRLESYWKQGARMAVVFNYTYSNGRYVRVRSRSLTVPEIDEYFRNKPPLDLMEELTEIRDFRAGDRRR